MKKKSLFYLASTAILIAASSQQIFADEPVKTSTPQPTVEVNKQEAHSSVELQTKEVTQTAPINQTTSSSSSKNEATASSTASTEAKVSEEQNVVKENSTTTTETKKDNKSTFFAAQNNQATARSNPDAQVKKSTFVDVSSHNGHISKEDYQHLAEKGVNGVVVKLTEGTSYKNPYAASQTQNAQAAGMQVSAYAFSHYTNEAEARAEARYFAEEARRLNLPSSTVMVNDIEDSDMRPNINATTQAWADEMRRMGFSNLMYYTSASWLDRNNLRTKGPIQTEQFGLENFWVAQYPTSKLSADDAKILKYNSEAGAWQFTSQAELLSGRHVFDQSVDYTGRFTNKATPSNRAANQPIKGKITVQNKNPNTGTFDVIVSDVSAPYGVREVKVPTWSNVNGQDDIIWYTAAKQTDGTYKVTVRAVDHKFSTGLYHIHLYYIQNNGKLVGVGGTTTELSLGRPQGKVTIANNNPDTGTFDVLISNVSSPYGVREVKVPTWSSIGGQDDIIWYTAKKQANGTYKVTVKATDHKKSTGEYNIHVYYIQENNQLVGVTGTTTTVSIAHPKGTLTITNNNPDAGTFDVIVSGVSSPDGVREVKLPTWSNVDGQDDIIWYTAKKQADGTYKTTVKVSDHKYSTGLYNVHLYYIQGNGKIVGVAGTQVNVSLARAKGNLTIQNNNPDTGTFDVIVSGVSSPYGVREVKLPTWSNVNGQDDIIWYTATRQANGTYKTTVKASDHKRSTGLYHIHLYYIQGNGKIVGIGGTTTEVSIARPKGTLTIQNKDANKGTFEVIVSNVSNPDGVREVKLPTWSNVNGQDDIIWYTATRQTNGTYKALIKASDHKNSTGLYYIHLYYVQNNGTLIGVGGTSTNVTISAENLKLTGKITIQNNNPKTGTFDVVVSNVSSPHGVREVKLPTWSSVNGQDDIIWYTAAKRADGTYKITVKASDHKNSIGEYNVHLYYIQNNGKLVGVGGTTVQVSKTSYPTPYFSQRDGRWAGRTYGGYTFAATGCVPTTVAMAISGTTGQTVLPTTVADYLYHSTNEFNKRSYGTTSHGIVLAARHWGLKTDVLGSTAAVREALAMGHHVLGAVGTSVFANYPVTHELVMKGYNNGMTYVMDPYNANNNGYYSVDYLFRVRSLDPTDNTEGSPFMTIRA
ncbi:GBS Bsp-like repeat-containing protein [Streptococcus anginosus]|uniref:GBS Bsp-like repeat-containing protein n=1 Tax=Streptococcus anginosus TaxID=1328 RepID=UPI00200122BB|nr:GBS Bsp-like repeat-containing protein [Streptococcus anginosus]MCY7210325.1 GBS Bsp-like repeat-containing protein [Streptococcus anginosus]MCY7227441.1 GBS Bsp-like repeat-containing protein [Streptococcus anginosus]MDU5127716.1 GBS Bsp-like repeat-containing protein [Streptococcus anginosus]MEE0847964.1 GBS Bsp-like repeat-containing protein [Streptococcus anginosus]